ESAQRALQELIETAAGPARLATPSADERLLDRRIVGHRRGARDVLCSAGRETELKRIAATLEPADVRTYAGDVREAAALSAAARDFIASVGVPDVVIASAGVSRGTLTSYAEDLPAFRAVFDTNVLGMVATFQPF